MRQDARLIRSSIELNTEVAGKIRSAADELGVIHAVLSSIIAIQPQPDSEMIAAVERISLVDRRLQQTADGLAIANQDLINSIDQE